MKKIVLRLSSITYAVKAQKKLKSINIASELIKFDNTNTDEGCAYALKINYIDFYGAAKKLREQNIPFSVLKTDNGE